uniref:Phorbol-ester/DAG-type domain-containing protein n=1 Tax=Timema monikensis TaxID=170555 RepID=A0A7R9E3D5_9NEOP|nr:unnamed protein product [Timema monikensis]
MYRQSASISTVVPLFTLSQPVFQQFSKSMSTKLILLHQPEVWARLLRGVGCAYVQPPATSLYFSSHNRAFTAPYLLQERGISPHPFQSLKREIAARDDVRVASASSVRPPPTREREREGETERSVPTHTHTQTHTGLSGNSELRHHRHGRLRRHRQTLRRELCALGLKLTVTEPAYGTAMIVYGSEITGVVVVVGVEGVSSEGSRSVSPASACVSIMRVSRVSPRCRGRLPIMAADQPAIHGHSFAKKTFHKPTYCHHCSDMLWGLIQQGYICEVAGGSVKIHQYQSHDKRGYCDQSHLAPKNTHMEIRSALPLLWRVVSLEFKSQVLKILVSYKVLETLVPFKLLETPAPFKVLKILIPSKVLETLIPSKVRETVTSFKLLETPAPFKVLKILVPSKVLETLIPSKVRETVTSSKLLETPAPFKVLETLVPSKVLETLIPSKVRETVNSLKLLETPSPSKVLETLVPSKVLETLVPSKVLDTLAPSHILVFVSAPVINHCR